jgi:hypothetical protein
MKYWIAIIVLFIAISNCLGQTQYVFNHVVIKQVVISEDSEENEGQVGERYQLINAQSDDYSAEVGLLPSGQYFIQLKDTKNAIFGRGIISKEAFLTNESYVINESYRSRFPKASTRLFRSKRTIDTLGPTQTLWQFRRKVRNKPTSYFVDEYTIDTDRFKAFQSEGFDRFQRRGSQKFNGWVTAYRILNDQGAVLSHWVIDTIVPTKRIIILKD